MSTLALAERQADILASLRHLEGRGTVGDVVARSGMPQEDVRAGLKALLESHRGHLAVSDSGELLYEFDPRLIERGTEPWPARAKRAVTSVLAKAFKVWIVVMLVVYFVIFVVLVIAALFASQRGGDSRDGGWGGGGRRGGGHFHFPNFLLWYWIWTPNWRLGRPYYGHRWERSLDKKDRVPFYKKVFAFVFGPDRPEPTQQQLDRSTLRLIRARRGVITTAELVEHTALTLPQAEDEMGRLIGAYGGEAAVAPDGVLVYAFPELMTSAHGTVRAREPNPAWLRLERPLETTGNTPGTNALVGGMNAFTMLASATAPWFIFPRLGLGGPVAVAGLVVIPLVFSVLFFAIPLVRGIGVRLENRRRAARNVRRVLLGLVYRRALDEADVGLEEAHRYVAARLEQQRVGRSAVERALHALAAELDADVAPDEAGELRFRFPSVRRQFLASETMRKRLQLERRTLGEIVYDTSDSPEEATVRDLALFDRQLAGDADLDRYLPAADRIDFEEDYEVVAFEEELARR